MVNRRRHKRPPMVKRYYASLKRQRRGRRKRRVNMERSTRRYLNKTKRRNRRTKVDNLGRSLRPNMIIRRAEKTTFYTLIFSGTATGNQILIATGGTAFEHDYTISDLMNGPDLIWIQTRYQYWVLLGFQITFWIQDLDSCFELATGTSSIFGSAMDPKKFPELYMLHCNDPQTQSNYLAVTGSDYTGQQQKWFGHPRTRKVCQQTRMTSQWHLPKAYHSVYATTAGVLSSSSVDSVFAGPTYNEPHGYVGIYNDAVSMVLPANAQIVFGMKIESIFGFRELLPGYGQGLI